MSSHAPASSARTAAIAIQVSEVGLKRIAMPRMRFDDNFWTFSTLLAAKWAVRKEHAACCFGRLRVSALVCGLLSPVTPVELPFADEVGTQAESSTSYPLQFAGLNSHAARLEFRLLFLALLCGVPDFRLA